MVEFQTLSLTRKRRRAFFCEVKKTWMSTEYLFVKAPLTTRKKRPPFESLPWQSERKDQHFCSCGLGAWRRTPVDATLQSSNGEDVAVVVQERNLGSGR